MAQRPTRGRPEGVKQRFGEAATAVTALYREAKSSYSAGYADALSLVRTFLLLTQHHGFPNRPQLLTAPDGEAETHLQHPTTSDAPPPGVTPLGGVNLRTVLAFIDKKLSEHVEVAPVCRPVDPVARVEDSPPPSAGTVEAWEANRSAARELVISLSPVVDEDAESPQTGDRGADRVDDAATEGIRHPGQVPAASRDIAVPRQRSLRRRPAGPHRSKPVDRTHRSSGATSGVARRGKRENEHSVHAETELLEAVLKRRRFAEPTTAVWTAWTKAMAEHQRDLHGGAPLDSAADRSDDDGSR